MTVKSKTRQFERVEIFFVRMVLGEVTVDGLVSSGSEFDINVSITSPFRNLSQGLHIPYFARAQCSYNGLYGHIRVTELLSDLYAVGTRLKRNLTALQADWHRLTVQNSEFLNLEPDDREIRVMEIEDRFFEQGFGETISMSLRRSLIPILEGKSTFE